MMQPQAQSLMQFGILKQNQSIGNIFENRAFMHLNFNTLLGMFRRHFVDFVGGDGRYQRVATCFERDFDGIAVSLNNAPRWAEHVDSEAVGTIGNCPHDLQRNTRKTFLHAGFACKSIKAETQFAVSPNVIAVLHD
jgi:hypothetical protein